MVDFSAIIGDVARQLLGAPNEDMSSRGELRFGAKGSLSVSLEKGTWYDWESNVGGGVVDLVRREVAGEDPLDWLVREGFADPARTSTGDSTYSTDDSVDSIDAEPTAPPRPDVRPRDPALEEQLVHDYRDERGELLFQVVRTEVDGKKVRVRQRQPNAARTGWVWNLKEVRRVLYGLPALIAAPLSAEVYVAEGERKVELLWSWGLAATCCPGGAGKWRPEYAEFFRGRRAVVLPDNDDAGRKHAESVVASLLPVAAEVRVLTLPGLPPKGDVVDWAAAGGTAERFAELAAGAAPAEAGGAAGDADERDAVEFSEDALALEFARRNQGRLRYVDRWGAWYVWDGQRWGRDDVREAYTRAREVCRDASIRAQRTKPLIARSLSSAKVRAAVVSLGGDDPAVRLAYDQVDADPWLLGTPGGVVDLKTGALRPAAPEDFITKITAVAPAALGTPCPAWDSFLEQVTGGDAALVAYLKRAAGYMLTGVTVEQALFFLYGLGGNGKSTFVGVVSGVMNDYHRAAPIETFMTSPNERHPTELAMLHGARLVTSVETEEGRRWAQSRINMLTGGDRVSARYMRQDFFEFDPTFKLVIFGNHRPGLRSVDEATRRRMNLVPFMVTIPRERRDVALGERLRAEWPAVLRWMVDGCLEWQRGRLDPPAAVVGATSRYLEAEDTIQAWLEDCCEVDDKEAFSATSWLFVSWKRWAEAAGEFVGSERRFSQRLESEGKKPGRVRVKSGGDRMQRGFYGVKLAAAAVRGGRGSAGSDELVGAGGPF